MSERTLPTTAIDWDKTLETAINLPGKAGAHYNAFHRYSTLNQARLMMQGVFEPVGPMKVWNKLGRWVITGHHPKEVIAPRFIKVENKASGEVEEHLIGFIPIRSAFGYSDTHGKELVIPEPPEWGLERALGSLAIARKPFERLDGNVQGYAEGRAIAINPVARYPLKTAVHEMAHIALGHTTPTEIEDYRQHKGLKEFGAEATAHLVLNELGMLDEEQAATSREYIQGWLDGEKPPAKAIQQVFVAAEKILRAGRLAPAIGHVALTEPAE